MFEEREEHKCRPVGVCTCGKGPWCEKCGYCENCGGVVGKVRCCRECGKNLTIQVGRGRPKLFCEECRV